MKTVQVVFTIKKEHISEFIQLTTLNVINSRKESGVLSFHFFQTYKDSSSFILLEQYNTIEDQLLHREKEHYKIWKNTIINFLEKPYEVIDLIEM